MKAFSVFVLAGICATASFAADTFTTYANINNDIKYMEVDRNGHVWFTTNDDSNMSLNVFNGDDTVQFTPENTGVPFDHITGLSRDPDGIVWFSTNDVMTFWDIVPGSSENWQTVTVSQPREFNSFDFDSKGRLWVAEMTRVGGPIDGGVGCYDGDNYVRYDADNSTVGNDAFIICVAPNDDVWVGESIYGVSHYDGAEWERFDTDAGLVLGYPVTSLAISPDSTVWVGGFKGTVSRYTPSGWDVFQLFDGAMSSYNYKVIVTLGAAPDGSVWAGTIYGAFRFDGTEWVQYTVDDGLASNAINSITVSDVGDVWIGTDMGLSKYTPENSTAVQEPAPSAYPLIVAHPNPFNPATTITVTIPEAGPASLAVYSITGQKVRELAAGPMSAGTHTFVWDGRDDAGTPVASGVYLTRLESTVGIVTGKLALVR